MFNFEATVISHHERLINTIPTNTVSMPERVLIYLIEYISCLFTFFHTSDRQPFSFRKKPTEFV